MRRLALAVALLAALVGSQGPEFAQQYRQRLGGAVEELKQIVAAFEAEAAKQGLSPTDALNRLERNADPLARGRGEDMAATIDRAARLQEQLRAMRSAGPVERLYIIAKAFDPYIAQSALDNYEPATPLSPSALAVAGLAGAGGWAAMRIVAWPLRRLPRLAGQYPAAPDRDRRR
ncbi:MAG: DUF2937 family protein [Acidobacteriaceae bacterium]|nr:DUF2937 family protein [Acidobacteriaceae bacterium]